MIEQKSFYLQDKKNIVYVLQTDKSNNYHGDIMRYEKGMFDDPECHTFFVHHAAHLKHLDLSKEKLEAEVIIENDIKKIYFPALNRSIDYASIIQEYIFEGSIWTQAQPFGYTYNVDLCPYGNLGTNAWDDMFDIIKWVHNNFDRLDYEITKIYGNSDDIYDEEAIQVGHGIWFKDINYFNLMKLTWGNTIYNLECKNDKCSK